MGKPHFFNFARAIVKKGGCWKMKSDFLIALTQLAAERNLPRETVISAIEAALVSAYRKDSEAAGQNIKVNLDPASGEVRLQIIKTTVDEVLDPETEIALPEAKKLSPEIELGTEVVTKTIIQHAGRIAAQTAKQVVMQRLREAERDLIYEEFAGKEGEVVTATIQRIEPRQIVVDIGRAEAIIPPQEQVPNERYRSGQKMRAILLEVQRTSRGPEIIVSRSHKELMKRLFELEVPEIFSGAVEIVGIAREAGSRSKVAVRSIRDGVDPVGSCVGLRGIRIQNIVNELQGEKIDVVEWEKDQTAFLANALSPAQVTKVQINEEDGSVVIVVPDRYLSLAIGKEGQNARLAAKLTGWKVDIRSVSQVEGDPLPEIAPVDDSNVAIVEKPETEESAATDILSETNREDIQPTESEEIVAPIEDIQEEAQVHDIESKDNEEELVVDGSSAEQELAALSLAVDEQQEQEKVEDVSLDDRSISLDEVPEEVWAVPIGREPKPGAVRFAEDIAGTRANRRAQRKNADVPSKKAKRGGKRSKGNRQAY